jgi:hypothetical protein
MVTAFLAERSDYVSPSAEKDQARQGSDATLASLAMNSRGIFEVSTAAEFTIHVNLCIGWHTVAGLFSIDYAICSVHQLFLLDERSFRVHLVSHRICSRRL